MNRFFKKCIETWGSMNFYAILFCPEGYIIYGNFADLNMAINCDELLFTHEN